MSYSKLKMHKEAKSRRYEHEYAKHMARKRYVKEDDKRFSKKSTRKRGKEALRLNTRKPEGFSHGNVRV